MTKRTPTRQHRNARGVPAPVADNLPATAEPLPGPLPAVRLYRAADLSALPFATTGDLAPLPGLPGQERTIWLRLKLIADAGLVGLPNAGKSTFLAAVSSARPKIADYPFTTLHPGLGVARAGGREFVIADIPGLIEGAHEGAGLGDRFLGHVERCRVLLHLVDGTGDDPAEAYRVIREELEAYGHGLEDKPEVVALSKADALTPEDRTKKAKALAKAAGRPPLILSAVSGEGVEQALQMLAREIAAAATADPNAVPAEPEEEWRP